MHNSILTSFFSLCLTPNIHDNSPIFGMATFNKLCGSIDVQLTFVFFFLHFDHLFSNEIRYNILKQKKSEATKTIAKCDEMETITYWFVHWVFRFEFAFEATHCGLRSLWHKLKEAVGAKVISYCAPNHICQFHWFVCQRHVFLCAGWMQM